MGYATLAHDVSFQQYFGGGTFEFHILLSLLVRYLQGPPNNRWVFLMSCLNSAPILKREAFLSLDGEENFNFRLVLTLSTLIPAEA